MVMILKPLTFLWFASDEKESLMDPEGCGSSAAEVK
jgi:hypothetical protein